MKEHLVLSGNFSLQFNLAWYYGDAMSRNRRLFQGSFSSSSAFTYHSETRQIERPKRKTWNLGLKEVFLIRKGNEVAQILIFQGTPFISPISVVRL